MQSVGPADVRVCLGEGYMSASESEGHSPRRVERASFSNGPLIAREALDDGSMVGIPGTEDSPQVR